MCIIKLFNCICFILNAISVMHHYKQLPTKHSWLFTSILKNEIFFFMLHKCISYLHYYTKKRGEIVEFFICQVFFIFWFFWKPICYCKVLLSAINLHTHSLMSACVQVYPQRQDGEGEYNVSKLINSVEVTPFVIVFETDVTI